MKRNAVIVDIDGTLADVSGIRHHVLNKPKRFDLFHSEAVNVPTHSAVVDMVNDFANQGVDIVVVTARKAKWRNHTAMWLALNNIPSTAMFMRANKDGRKDAEVKRDILKRIQQTWNVIHAIDDNPNVIAVWIANGIDTTTVAGWDR